MTVFVSLLPITIFGAQRAKPLAKKKGKAHESKISKEVVQAPYQLTAPKGWQCVADKSQLPAKVELIYIGTGKGQFNPSLNIAKETTTMDLKDYVAFARKYHEKEGSTTSHLGSIDTPEGKAMLVQIDRNTQWGNVRFLQASLIKDETAYVITATCLQNEFGNFYAPFLQAIQSFTINNPLALNDKEK